MLFLSLLTGMLLKLLDDFLDMELSNNKLLIQLLQTSITALTALISSNDIVFGLFAAFALIEYYVVDTVDNEYWKALFIAPLIGIVSSYKEIIPSFSNINLLIFLYSLTIFVLLGYVDMYYFKEEVSYSKLYGRFGVIIYLSIHLIFKTFNETKGVSTFMSYAIGYLLTSCLVQVYMLFIKPKDNEGTQKENN